MCWYSRVKIYFCFTLGVNFLFEWFYFPLCPKVILFSTIPWGFDFIFHYTLGIRFYFPLRCFPFCFPLGLFFRHVLHYGSTRHVLHYGVGVGRAHSCPFVGRHGMATLKPTKVKDGIFKPVAGRYIFLSGVTWLKI
jgi:hypothetical protein